jgi:hypothetical protein
VVRGLLVSEGAGTAVAGPPVVACGLVFLRSLAASLDNCAPLVAEVACVLRVLAARGQRAPGVVDGALRLLRQLEAHPSVPDPTRVALGGVVAEVVAAQACPTAVAQSRFSALTWPDL